MVIGGVSSHHFYLPNASDRIYIILYCLCAELLLGWDFMMP